MLSVILLTYLLIFLLACLFQIKCDQYWPNRGSEVYGVMQVTLLDVIELATYTIRTFQLARVGYLPERLY